MCTKLKLLVFTLTVIFIVVSCDSDDTPEFDESLLGTWTLNATLLTGCSDPANIGATDVVCDSDTCTRLVISDGRYERRATENGQEVVTEQGKIRLSENNIFFTEDNTTSGEVFSFAVETNTLLLASPTRSCNQTLRYTK